MRSRRSLWPLMLVLLLLLGALGVGGWFAYRMKVTQAAVSMLDDALQMGLEPRTRPVHATSPTIVGNFGKCAEPRLDGWKELLKTEPDSCKAFRAPGAPAGKMPEECQAIVAPGNSLAWARGLMSCSRADAAGLPEGIFTQGHPRNGPAFTPWIEAAKVLAWEIRDRVSLQQYGLAFETCADVIATSRDLSFGGALLGAMAGAANLRIIFPACADAVAGADPAARAKFHAALETIREGKRTNSALLRDEAVLAGVEHFGFELDPKQRASLPKELRERIRPAPSPFPAPLVIGWQLVELRARTAELRAIADLPFAEREPLIAALAEKHQRTQLTSTSIASQEKFLRRADEAATLVQLLSAAANVDVEPPATTASYTVAPAEGGFALTPLDPDAAQYAIRVAIKPK